ncbi:MAG: hypothetical protein CFK49_10320 [Armatimonadetes bacterium JP3_11]|nr:MAG: hypothetical protein CFK48_07665 [Armatimonadetes bacterium CP1_7O]OYT74010.1 MAG: hypothetical protein CFK49_10320 [Armatimonadetes bacterium JP3_11]
MHGCNRWLILMGIGSLLIAGVQAQGSKSPEVSLSGVLRVQWSDRANASGTDGFDVRLARIAAEVRRPQNVQGRISVEFAAGASAHEAQLLDAYGRWQASRSLALWAGQMLLPLFYDVRTSVTRIEALERTNLVNTYFAGARGRGIALDYMVAPSTMLQVGLWNSLTNNDPQATTRGARAHVMASLNLRYETSNYQANLGGLWGERPGFQTRDPQNNPLLVPSATRRTWYLEQELRLRQPQLTLRGTYLEGRDRNPTGGVSAPQFLTPSDYRAITVYAIYQARHDQQIALRWEDFDPDTARQGNSLRTLGLFYHYFPMQGVRLTLGYEWAEMPTRHRAIGAVQYQF